MASTSESVKSFWSARSSSPSLGLLLVTLPGSSNRSNCSLSHTQERTSNLYCHRWCRKTGHVRNKILESVDFAVCGMLLSQIRSLQNRSALSRFEKYFDNAFNWRSNTSPKSGQQSKSSCITWCIPWSRSCNGSVWLNALRSKSTTSISGTSDNFDSVPMSFKKERALCFASSTSPISRCNMRRRDLYLNAAFVARRPRTWIGSNLVKMPMSSQIVRHFDENTLLMSMTSASATK